MPQFPGVSEGINILVWVLKLNKITLYNYWNINKINCSHYAD